MLEVVVFFALVATSGAIPQEYKMKKEVQAEGPLPFLQFTNGGIRVNFGGYHAEAGLGGLLGDSRAGGGLHASAGTPFGAHASAGLGGLLGGDSGTAGGGLHARAGLGNGRPEAAAGLGGILDGSANPEARAAGGLYAGATAGNAAAFTKNVQVIDRKKSAQFQKVKVVPAAFPNTGGSATAAASASSQASANTIEKQKDLNVQPIQEVSAPAVSQAELFGGLYAGADTGVAVSKTVHKVHVPVSKIVVEKEIISAAPVVASAGIQGEVNTDAMTGKHLTIRSYINKYIQ
ncbi:nuclear pore complex protein nup54-like [Orussus abietinus]|uniref:nuclear pore complex protein nup54-like n=1 Tax=Orussus abietinus TaxID=222816 RepID=UPI000C7160D9|nr:nuclear pore complex protein nup54-like [Orussus abietinus]